MITKKKICVIGLGRISESHLIAIKKLKKLCELEAVVDIRKEVTKEIAKKYESKKYYFKIEDALNDDKIDAVVICLPNHLHCEMAVRAARAKKNILIEKPMANTSKEADKMIEEADLNGVILMVGQCRRFFDAVIESKRRVEKIGKIFNIINVLAVYFKKAPTSWWRAKNNTGGGLVIDVLGPHPVDYVLWLYDKKPLTVYAQAYRNNSDWEGEDEAVILLKFDDDAMATIHLSFNTYPEINQRLIIGKKGTMRLYGETELWMNEKHIIHGKKQSHYLKGSIDFVYQMKEFLSAINEGREPIANGKEVKKVVEVLEAAKASLISGKPIRLI